MSPDAVGVVVEVGAPDTRYGCGRRPQFTLTAAGSLSIRHERTTVTDTVTGAVPRSADTTSVDAIAAVVTSAQVIARIALPEMLGARHGGHNDTSGARERTPCDFHSQIRVSLVDARLALHGFA